VRSQYEQVQNKADILEPDATTVASSKYNPDILKKYAIKFYYSDSSDGFEKGDYIFSVYDVLEELKSGKPLPYPVPNHFYDDLIKALHEARFTTVAK
jgi:hypothetical protein